jgi:hypothetical protein
MKKYLNFGILAGFLLLAGCQTRNSGNGGLFTGDLFNSSPTYGMSLAQSVQNALVRSEDPVIANVHIETNQNKVILSGYVKKIRQSDVAEQIARQVPGVQAVENNLIVRQ